ncbi:transcriptional regulator, AraC family protein [Fulvimarina pelagi HTCC2506]|uniref:Transcriptional regulator, AraC family protein n=2 Tax=Fulvimarina pelagi TaxID=217511 RepID=Q0G2T5_9HYPH|nr:transcriptional regulator, AraC family protein [Fulvimarina pelagi HTCC2506]
MSYASAIEPFRAANILSGRTLYSWRHVAVEDLRVEASTGLSFEADHAIGEAEDYDGLVVCAAGNPSTFDHEPTFAWLRRLARRGTWLAGVSGGPFVLASAGLLDGYRCTIHWEHAPAFAEAFAQPRLTSSIYEIDRGRLTCAGGISALDMMHAVIAKTHGGELAAAVSEWFLQSHVRTGATAQLMTRFERFGLPSVALSNVIQAIEENVEHPLPRERLAELAGVSIRQLERLFEKQMKTTVDRYYLTIRLHHAQRLLRQTRLSVAEIGIASGFASASYFSRAYKSRYGHGPRDERSLNFLQGKPVDRTESL